MATTLNPTSTSTTSDVKELAPDESMNPNLIDFPDGGAQAWMTALGGFLSTVAGIGVLSGFSVFQSYYSAVGLAGYSPADVAWIGNLQIWGCFAFGLFSGWLSDSYGPQLPMAVGSFFMVLGTMMASISTKYYQFILSQGLCSAIGIGLTFVPSLAVPCQWFLKKRAIVVGLVLSGQNIGGVIWPIVVNNMINDRGISFGWTLRTIGFLQLVLMVLATLLMHRRFYLPPQGLPSFPIKAFVKHRATLVFTLAMFIGFLGIYIPYFYITVYGIQYGMDTTLAFYYSAILNAAAFFGCHVTGYLADTYFGAFNTITLLALGCGVTAFGWIGAQANGGIIAWTVIYGLLTGGMQAIVTPCVGVLAPDPEVIPTWDGMVLIFVSFAVLGTGSIAGQLLENTGGMNYVPMQVLTGVALTTSGLLLLVVRLIMVKQSDGHTVEQ